MHVALTIEHNVKLQSEEDARKLVFLVANSKPTNSSTRSTQDHLHQPFLFLDSWKEDSEAARR